MAWTADQLALIVLGLLFNRAYDSAADVDRRSFLTPARTRARSVDDSYNAPFRFTGAIDKLTFDLGPSQI